MENNIYNDITEKLNHILNKIENLEKTYISLNSDLINQNIRMSEIYYGKLKEPILTDNTNSNNEEDNKQNSIIDNTKELFYYENNGKIIVYGSGTYDNRPILRQFGEWNSINRTWDLVVTMDKLIEKLPYIIKKEKNV